MLRNVSTYDFTFFIGQYLNLLFIGRGGMVQTCSIQYQNSWILLSGVSIIFIILKISSFASHASYALSGKSGKLLSKKLSIFLFSLSNAYQLIGSYTTVLEIK